MIFDKIRGQSQVIGLLQSAIAHQRVSQAYLFHGPDGVGKFITALYFGMALNCLSAETERPCGHCASCRKFMNFEHADFHYLFPSSNLMLAEDGTIKSNEALKEYQAYIQNKIQSPWQDFHFSSLPMIRKESISLLIRRLDLSIREGDKRIVIIENAEMMNIATANAFLKSLEEPPKNTVIILVTEHYAQLLPTIVSRCQPVYFKPLARAVIEEILRENFHIADTEAKNAARISGGNLKSAIRIAQDTADTARKQAFEFLALAANGDELGFLGAWAGERVAASVLQDLIAYLAVIVNDLAVVNAAPDEISNLDRSGQIKALAHEDIAFGVPDFLSKLDDFSRRLEGNVNPSLIQLNLFIELKNFLLGAG